MRVLTPLLIAAMVASVRLPAQTISGRVFDSVAKAPLAGATVELVSSNPASANPVRVTTDNSGQYVLTNVPPGKYVLGFYHDVLDSIGIEPPFVRIEVGSAGGASALRVDLAVPSPAHILTAICGRQPAKDSLGILLGHLYDASTRQAVQGGHVVAEWRSFGVVGGKFQMSNPQAIATTAANGWFAICGVPRGEDVVLEAARGNDTTGAVTVRVPAHGLARRDLFVDKNGIGRSRLTGTVVDATSGRPLRDAQVTISGAALTGTTNDRGVFTITDAPGGTQTVLVRAIAYAPEQRTVDLLGETPLSIDVRLTSLRTMLDTMRVTANKLYGADANGFDRRRKSGSGTYIDAADIERARPFQPTDLLKSLNGLYVVGSGFNQRIVMTGLRNCEPAIVIDGVQLPDLTGADLNMMVSPEEIVGVEVYTSAGRVPAQFKGMTPGSMGCGAVVVWTKR